MGYRLVEDKEIDLTSDELAVVQKVESHPVLDSELVDIENHLKRLYLNNLCELYREYEPKINFSRFVMRPLFVAGMYFCKGEYKDVAKLLGITVSNLKYKLAVYLGTSDLAKFSLTKVDKRFCTLYENYLEQVLVNGVSDKFKRIVDRAMYRAVMEFSGDDIVLASEILGIRKATLLVELDKYFDSRKSLG